MGIYRGSRYRFSDLIQSTDSDGDVNGVFTLRQMDNEVPQGSIAYTTQTEDSFESLAYKYYGDSNKWYVIADVNPSVFWPLDLDSGELIYVPSRSQSAIK